MSDRRDYHREYMRKYRAGKKTVQENGLSHLIDQLEWKPIPGYPGYMASKCGQILSLERNLVRKNGRPHTIPARVLKQNPDGKGYMQVRLYINKKGLSRQVARLVYLAWCGEIAKGLEVDHIDNNKLNNQTSNLQLLTSQENTQKIISDAFKAGYIRALEDQKNALGDCSPRAIPSCHTELTTA